ncbi:MAG TPA: AbrB/MazE/SpoVT family DNA-binding domain-containing protein [Candidatus Bathyarchaeota archaeon]|nr:AbrB/MazE/SpoVT family DNA-binding domain-containing protein [Candidatus Bathyarchaeota archaeon]
MEVLVRLDEDGKITLPEDVRAMLGSIRLLRLTVRGGRLVLEPVEDPLKRLASLVRTDIRDVEVEICRLRKLAEEELMRAVRERWG